MMSYWDKIGILDFPVLVITGEHDKKYSEIGRNMHSKLPNARLNSVPDCGHNVHLEKPEVFTKLVTEFLTNI
jgi:2-succinyl-6-hydroxy-2,4-cyclohexadiene-1-carboxylate synthase